MSSNGHGIDWDGELQTLMESSGVNPAELVRPRWKTRAWRKIRGARAALVAAAITLPLMWLTVRSGAPEAATTPLRIWFAGWIGYGVWISLSRPDWSTGYNAAREFSTTTWQAGSRFVFAHSRPLRARWRAWRTTRDRATATA